MRRTKFTAAYVSVLAIFLGSLSSGCNRGAMRLYGLGASFPPAATNFSSKTTHLEKLFVSLPVDKTAQYYDQFIAGTSWQGTRTDTFGSGEMSNLVYRELRREIQSAKIFSGIDQERTENGLVLETEIRSFGAQVRGLFWMRVGGVAAFKFTLRRNEGVLFEKVYEKVVKDGDPEYTGSSFGFIEDAMRATMSDSFREVLKAFFSDLEQLSISPQQLPSAE
ncbi:MAG: hypothetical protein A2Y02_00095 [Omnitrophica bacterium GWA2_52_12]|nr:MAG: hypothetical protein A2Y02_00095 [Omnitrophica bacterium GWA2_52_12]